MGIILGIQGESIEENFKLMQETLKHRGKQTTHKENNLLLSSTNIQKNNNLTLLLDGVIYNNLPILESINKYLNNGKSLEESVTRTIKQLDGDYSLAISNGETLILARDSLGTKPLYYGENKQCSAFASEKKALNQININEIKTLLPGHILHNKEIKKIINPLPWEKTETEIENLSYLEIKDKLKNLIVESTQKRIQNTNKVALLFSAGVDSTILATILKKENITRKAYVVGDKNSPDVKYAQETAKKLDMELETIPVTEEKVKETLDPVIEAIEEFNIMKIGVGMTLYLASQKAHQDGYEIILAGQGADELFAGYSKCLRLYDENKPINYYLKEYIKNMHHVNLERDNKITSACQMEVRTPYLDPKLVEFALNIPEKYKIKSNQDKLRKHILREIALELDVPEEIAHRPKKAAQYGSGIHKILTKKILKHNQKYKS